MLVRRTNLFVFPSEVFIRFVVILLNCLGLVPIILSSFFAIFILVSDNSWSGIYMIPITCLNGIVLLASPLIFVYFYWLKPKQIIRKYNLKPLEDKYPDFHSTILQTAREMGITQNIQLWLQDGNTKWYPLTFGTRRRPNIMLPEGLILHFKNRNFDFKPIIVHELAHILNGDVWQIAMAQALIRAIIAPSMLSAFGSLTYLFFNWQFSTHNAYASEGIGYLLGFTGWCALVPFGLIILINSMQRYRELYADAKTATVLGSAEAVYETIARFEIVVATQQEKPIPEIGLGWSTKIPRWIRYIIPIPHVTIEERRLHLLENWRLLDVTILDFYTLGALLLTSGILFAISLMALDFVFDINYGNSSQESTLTIISYIL